MTNSSICLFSTHAEHDGVLEMHGGGSAFAQSLIRTRDVVVEAGIEIVYGDRLFEQLDRRPVSPRRLINNSEKIEARRVRGSLRQDLLADDLGLREPPRSVSLVGLCHQPGNVGWTRSLARPWRARQPPGAHFGSSRFTIGEFATSFMLCQRFGRQQHFSPRPPANPWHWLSLLSSLAVFSGWDLLTVLDGFRR